MTNLIEKVAELRKLEEKATHAPWAPGRRETGCIADDNGAGTVVLRRTNAGLPAQENIELICGLRNAAPKLLDALGEIRAGDAEIISLFVEFMEKHKPDGHLNDTGPGAKITNAEATDCLRRYRDMARRMEENR